MGCFFSKKSRRKSPKKDSALPAGDESATGSDLPETNNTALGSNSNQEAPKLYSWDKREKVTLHELHFKTHIHPDHDMLYAQIPLLFRLGLNQRKPNEL